MKKEMLQIYLDYLEVTKGDANFLTITGSAKRGYKNMHYIVEKGVVTTKEEINIDGLRGKNFSNVLIDEVWLKEPK